MFFSLAREYFLNFPLFPTSCSLIPKFFIVVIQREMILAQVFSALLIPKSANTLLLLAVTGILSLIIISRKLI